MRGEMGTMKTYVGTRTEHGASVSVIDRRGRVSPLLRFRSPAIPDSVPFDWGNSGEGASRLALSLLLDWFGDGDRDLAIKLHAHFRDLVLAHLKIDEWTLDEEQVRISIVELTNEAAVRLKYRKEK